MKGGIGKFSFSGGDKSLKVGVNFSGGDWDIVTHQIFDKLMMHKIRNKKYFFLITSQEMFHLAKYTDMSVDLCLHLFKKSLSITLKTPSFLSIKLPVGNIHLPAFRGGLAVQTSGGDNAREGGLIFQGGGWNPSAHYVFIKTKLKYLKLEPI